MKSFPTAALITFTVALGLATSVFGISSIGTDIDFLGTKQTSAVVDNTATNPPVPEPATMLLFGTGLAGLAGIIRSKKD